MYNTRASASGNFYVKSSDLELYKLSFSRFGTKLWNEIPCNIRHLAKNKFKKKKAKSLRKLFFDILNLEDDYIYTPTLIKEVKLAKKCRKINSCLLVATFTTYLFNCFSFSLLSSPHPCYDFFFIYL